MHHLHTGMRSSHAYRADAERPADRYGNPGVAVSATPPLVELLEIRCLGCVGDELDDGHVTGGARIDVRQLAAPCDSTTLTTTLALTELDPLRHA